MVAWLACSVRRAATLPNRLWCCVVQKRSCPGSYGSPAAWQVDARTPAGIGGEVGVGEAEDRNRVEQPRVVKDVAADGLFVGGELAAPPPRERELERLLPDEEVHDTHAAVGSPAVGVANPTEPLGGVDHALDAQRVGDAAVEPLRRPRAEPFPDRARILAARTDQVFVLGPAGLQRGDRLTAGERSRRGAQHEVEHRRARSPHPAHVDQRRRRHARPIVPRVQRPEPGPDQPDQIASNARWSSGSSQQAAICRPTMSYRPTVDQR